MGHNLELNSWSKEKRKGSDKRKGVLFPLTSDETDPRPELFRNRIKILLNATGEANISRHQKPERAKYTTQTNPACPGSSGLFFFNSIDSSCPVLAAPTHCLPDTQKRDDITDNYRLVCQRFVLGLVLLVGRYLAQSLGRGSPSPCQMGAAANDVGRDADAAEAHPAQEWHLALHAQSCTLRRLSTLGTHRSVILCHKVLCHFHRAEMPTASCQLPVGHFTRQPC